MRGHVNDAEDGVADLKALDNQEAKYWMAVVCAMKGNVPDAFKLATDLLEHIRRCIITCVLVFLYGIGIV